MSGRLRAPGQLADQARAKPARNMTGHRRFAHVAVRIKCERGSVTLVPNAPGPTAFETSDFSGVAMVMCRPERPEDDPLYWKPMFKGRDRMLELQIQGRFKRRLDSMIYIGGELPKRMQLGLITRSLLKLVHTEIHPRCTVDAAADVALLAHAAGAHLSQELPQDHALLVRRQGERAAPPPRLPAVAVGR